MGVSGISWTGVLEPRMASMGTEVMNDACMQCGRIMRDGMVHFVLLYFSCSVGIFERCILYKVSI